MLINVPQYIDVEDKVAGPLTMKQLGWIIFLGVILLILWNVLSGAAFIIAAIPLTLFFVAMAFFKPYGQPMGNFLIFGIMYFFRPKVYVWKRMAETIPTNPVPKVEKQPETFAVEKHVNDDSIRNLAQLLDSNGEKYNKELEEILKKPPVKKA